MKYHKCYDKCKDHRCLKCLPGPLGEQTQDTTSAGLSCYVDISEEDTYLEKLWDCYQNGMGEGLPEKQLFVELIRDLIKQLTIPGYLRTT